MKRALRLVFIAFVALIGVFVLLGPGIMLTPLAPRGFKSISDGTNKVFYQTEEETARGMLRIARQARASILQFWGDPGERRVLDGLKVYLGESPEAYYRLTFNRAGGSAMFGSVIVINLSKVGQIHSMADFIYHEMAHIYLRRRFGYLTKHLAVPMWLDEGSALLIQKEAPFMDHFECYVDGRPRLVSVRRLRYATQWESVVSAEGGALAGLHYGYVGTFTDHLRGAYGVEKLRSYMGSLSLLEDPEDAFEAAFGRSLAEEESRWMSDQKEAGLIPSETKYAPVAPGVRVVVRWSVLFGLLFVFALWSLRQVCRVVRAVGGWLRATGLAS